MRTKNKYKLLYILTIIGILFALIAAVFFLLFTHLGSTYISKKVFDSILPNKTISWMKNQGNLIGGMEYKDIVFEDLEFFPKPNKLSIQRLAIDINSFSLEGINLYLENARLILPGADPVLLYGKYENQLLDFNIYSKSLTDNELESILKQNSLKNISIDLSGIDIFIGKSINEPKFSGEFFVNKISKNGFTIEQSPCKFDIIIKNNGDLGLFGTLKLNSGTVKGNKTALIHLEESKILFDGDPGKPNFEIKANSIVEKLKINIIVKGSFTDPDLQITSVPPQTKECLMIALATNKTWKNTEDMLNKGSISVDFAKDFIDYFIFGGQKNKFAEKFGLKSFSVKYDDKVKGISAIKDITGKLQGEYGIEETKDKDNKTNITQKVGGEYKITDTISFEAKKELKKTDDSNQEENKPADDQLLLKFKKSF